MAFPLLVVPAIFTAVFVTGAILWKKPAKKTKKKPLIRSAKSFKPIMKRQQATGRPAIVYALCTSETNTLLDTCMRTLAKNNRDIDVYRTTESAGGAMCDIVGKDGGGAIVFVLEEDGLPIASSSEEFQDLRYTEPGSAAKVCETSLFFAQGEKTHLQHKITKEELAFLLQ